MAITIICISCGAKLNAPDRKAGKKKARCPLCGAMNQVPDAAVEEIFTLACDADPHANEFIVPEVPAPKRAAERYLSLEEAAKTLCTTPEEVKELFKSKILRGFRDGQRTMFRLGDVEEFARERGLNSDPEAFELLIDSRIDRWGLADSDFRKDLDRVKQLSKSDPDMALAKCRQVLESCMNALHRSKGSDPGTKRLEQLISEAGRQGMLPRKVLALCEVVRELGNVGTHPVLDDEKLTHREAQIAILSLTIVLEWYIRNVQKNPNKLRID